MQVSLENPHKTTTLRFPVARNEQRRREMGDRLKELRSKRGYKQQYIADRIGVTLRTYQMYQAGSVEPGQEKLEKLAELYGVTPEYILRGDTPQIPSVTDVNRRLKRIEDQLADILEQRQAGPYTPETAAGFLDRLVTLMEALERQPPQSGRKEPGRSPSPGQYRRTRQGDG